MAVAKGKSDGLIGKITGSFRKKTKPAAKKAAKKTEPQKPDTPFEKKERPVEPVNWPADRLNVIEKLWGTGYTTPDGAERIKHVLPLLHLDEKKSILLLGPGLGGICETMVEETGVWITGYEPDKELARLGQEGMKKAGLHKKSPIRFDPLEDLGKRLKPKSYDAMVAFDALHFVKDKKALFEAITDALRINSEMMFVAYVLPDTNPPSKKVDIWAKHQSLPVHLWPAEAMLAMLKSLDLDVRPPEDVTRDYRNRVLQGWMNFLSGMKRDELLDKAADVVGECETWADLITAIDTGGLKVLRFNCIRLQERRKSVEELMAQT